MPRCYFLRYVAKFSFFSSFVFRHSSSSIPTYAFALFSMLPAAWYFFYVMSFYMKTSREAKVRTRVIAAAIFDSVLVGSYLRKSTSLPVMCGTLGKATWNRIISSSN